MPRAPKTTGLPRKTAVPRKTEVASTAEVASTTEVPSKIVCLETYWGDHDVRVFRDRSVLPFLGALAAQFEPPLRVAHRFVDSLSHLAHYTARPGGLLWRDADVFDVPVFYLSFHGAPGALRSARERIEADALCKAFEGWGRQYDNLLHFAACRIFAGPEGRKFAADFLRASGCRAVLGYTEDVDWTESMLTDLLFLRRFFTDSDPWKNIERIHQSVLDDFAPARRLGFELHLAARR
jgi:hypothetical protein